MVVDPTATFRRPGQCNSSPAIRLKHSSRVQYVDDGPGTRLGSDTAMNGEASSGARSFTIRDAIADDAMAIARVHVRAWQVGYESLLPDTYLAGLRPEDRASRYRFGDDASGTTIVASDGAAIVGFASFGPSRDDNHAGAGELYAIYVDPPSWGRGLGNELLARVCADLGGTGYRNAHLSLLEGNERAERFYLARGWHADGHRREEDIWGTPASVVCFRRDLP